MAVPDDGIEIDPPVELNVTVCGLDGAEDTIRVLGTGFTVTFIGEVTEHPLLSLVVRLYVSVPADKLLAVKLAVGLEGPPVDAF